jgi:hypothetical protein
MKSIFWSGTMILLAAALSLSAQDQPTHQVFQMKVQAPGGAAAAGTVDTMVFVGGPGLLPAIEPLTGRVIKGAPYSAEAVTSSVQTLIDGNRISNTTTTKMWRDSEGRTRVENTINPAGLWVPETQPAVITIIDDPVSGAHYTLNDKEKTATKFVLASSATAKAVTKPVDGKTQIVEHQIIGEKVITQGPAVFTYQQYATTSGGSIAIDVASREVGAVSENNVKKEDLGTQVIESVPCTGTRTTITIPAGQIGNDLPIETVTERWFSKDLGFEMLRKHSDPRSGEVTYKVTNLVRAEQPRSLFEVPPDYKVEDVTATSTKIRGLALPKTEPPKDQQ